MENDEQNLGSQEPASSTNKSSGAPALKKYMPIAIIVGVILLVAIIFMAISRSPKATVKDFFSSLEKGNSKKFLSTVDIVGMQSFAECGEKKLGKFDETYKENLKDTDKEDIEEYKEYIDESFESMNDEMENEDISFKIKEIKTSKVDDSKKLTEVKAKVEFKADGEKHTETITFYTIKKGLKSYIVSMDGNLF